MSIDPATNQFVDETRSCPVCHQPWTFTAAEQEWIERKGYTHAPARCKPCRAADKAAKAAAGGAGGTAKGV